MMDHEWLAEITSVFHVEDELVLGHWDYGAGR